MVTEQSPSIWFCWMLQQRVLLIKVTHYKSEDGAWTIEASPAFMPSSMNLKIPPELGNACPDVDTAWPGYTNGATSGFETTIDVSSLHHDPDCGHTIEIFAQDSDGNTFDSS